MVGTRHSAGKDKYCVLHTHFDVLYWQEIHDNNQKIMHSLSTPEKRVSPWQYIGGKEHFEKIKPVNGESTSKPSHISCYSHG